MLCALLIVILTRYHVSQLSSQTFSTEAVDVQTKPDQYTKKIVVSARMKDPMNTHCCGEDPDCELHWQRRGGRCSGKAGAILEEGGVGIVRIVVWELRWGL